MKKILLISLGVMILSLAMVGAASANNGPHGNYSATTDKCAGCHRAHTAKGMYLLVGANEYDFCLSCHGDGLGAGTDVKNGVWANAGVTPSGTQDQRLNGGGFQKIMGATVSSKHNVAGDGEFATAWGGATTDPASNQQGTNLKGVLECTSCHNPHGSASYRILNSGTAKWQTTAANSFGIVPMSPKDVSASGGDPNAIDNTSRGYTWNADQMALGIMREGFGPRTNSRNNIVIANYGNDISTFCGGCHTRYVGGSGNWAKDWTQGQGLANGPDGAQAAAYAHRSRQDSWSFTTDTSHGLNPGAYQQGDGWWNPASLKQNKSGYPRPLVFGQSTDVADEGYYLQTCLTCHFAHGTSAVMQNWAAGVNNPNSVGFQDGSSANLFYDNRGVCITCHNP